MNPLNPVETTVMVSGKQIHFVSLKLSQHFYTHHSLEVLVDFEELDSQWLANPVTLINYIGESIDVTFTHKVTGETNVFSGIITNVTMKGRHGTQNHILIHGADPSVKLSDYPTIPQWIPLSIRP